MGFAGLIDDAEAALQRAHEPVAAVVDPTGLAGHDLGFDHAHLAGQRARHAQGADRVLQVVDQAEAQHQVVHAECGGVERVHVALHHIDLRQVQRIANQPRVIHMLIARIDAEHLAEAGLGQLHREPALMTGQIDRSQLRAIPRKFLRDQRIEHLRAGVVDRIQHAAVIGRRGRARGQLEGIEPGLGEGAGFEFGHGRVSRKGGGSVVEGSAVSSAVLSELLPVDLNMPVGIRPSAAGESIPTESEDQRRVL